MIRFFLGLVLVTFLCIAEGHAHKHKSFKIQMFTLENGLRVCLIKSKRAPVIFSRLFYLVGSNDEDPNKTGLAHYLEHLLFQDASNELKAEDIEVFDNKSNAFTYNQFTCFEHDIPSQRIEEILKYDAGLMQSLSVPQDKFLNERQVVLNELYDDINDPSVKFDTSFDKVFFEGSPFARPIIGEADHIPTLNMEDVQKFYNTWYCPNNAILVLGGDIQRKQIEPLIRHYFGAIPSKKLPHREDRIDLKPLVHDQHLSPLEHEQVNVPTMTMMFRYSYDPKNRAMVEPVLEVLDRALLSDGSLFEKKLLKPKKSIFSHIDCRTESVAPGQGWIRFKATLKASKWSDKKLRDAEHQILSVIKEVAKKGVKKKAIQKAIADFEIAELYGKDSLESTVRHTGLALAKGYSLKEIQEYSTNIKKVKKKDVVKMLNEMLDADQRLTGWVVPQRKVKEGFQDDTKW